MENLIIRSPKRMKVETSPKKADSGPSSGVPEGYDGEIWDCLPENIKSDVIRDIAAQNLRASKSCVSSSTSSSSGAARGVASSCTSSSSSRAPTWSAFARVEAGPGYGKGVAAEEGAQVLFVDTAFPADASSIDGRVVSSTKTCPNCKCGGRAGKKKVSKDGPNQGRTFLGCYKPSADMSRCDFFMWGDNVAHDSRALALSWQRMRPNDGYI